MKTILVDARSNGSTDNSNIVGCLKSVRAAEDFSRTRLSKSFFMRDFLFSEIGAIERFSNLPNDQKLAITAGRGLCENVLEPLQATFGRLAIRSAYRSPEVNGRYN